MNHETRRDEIVAYILLYRAEHGRQTPSLQEIGAALHISRNAVYEHMSKLVEEGRAERRDGKFWLIADCEPIVG